MHLVLDQVCVRTPVAVRKSKAGLADEVRTEECRRFLIPSSWSSFHQAAFWGELLAQVREREGWMGSFVKKQNDPPKRIRIHAQD